MLKRILIALCLAVALIGASTLGAYAYWKWQKAKQLSEWEATYNEAAQMVQSGAPAAALDLLNTHFNPKIAGQAQQAWPPLMVQAAIDSRSYPQLESLVAKYPGVLRQNEAAALWWMRAQMHLGMYQSAEELALLWPEDKRTQPFRWRLLEADALMRLGQGDAALESLQAWQGEGSDEVNRQVRIALLSGEDTALILEALNRAFTEQPSSAELRAMSAEFLERMGAIAQARRNYVAAFLLQPENPLYGHLLANFYLRSAALPQAIETWRDSYAQTRDPRAWWQVWFWERVTRPRGEALQPEAGEWWGALTVALSQTPPDAFLSPNFLAEHLRPPAILDKSEAYHWLWALESIRIGDEAMALEVLRSMPTDRVELAPELRGCMTALLEWREEGTWPRGLAFGANPRDHRFLRFLETYRPLKAPDSSEILSPMESFLASEYAVSALLMANGWMAAADRLMPGPIPAELYSSDPALNWLPFADTKTQAVLHGAPAGLIRSEAYPDDLAVEGFAGELLLLNGQVDQGLAKLERVLETPGAAGYRAAYLRALAALEQNDWPRFESIFDERKDLAASVSGQELQARAALASGRSGEAAKIYRSLGSESVEGCVYRYRLALNEADFDEARSILNTLLELAPNEATFRDWLNQLNTLDG
jgi:Flp pilus assembly protein TadD